MSPRQVPEQQTPAQPSPARSLEDAANSENTLQGYAAINEVDEHSEIAEEAASEIPDDREEIARLAYRYYLDRGGAHGYDEQDWYRAEDEIGRQRG